VRLALAEFQGHTTTPKGWPRLNGRTFSPFRTEAEHPDYQEISLATDAIFLNSAESLAAALPSFWRSYFAGNDSEPDCDEPSYRANQDGVSVPSPLLTQQPEHSEAARQAGYRGRVEMSLIVDKAGNPQGLRIVKPAGLGLDEESVKAVQQWKFRHSAGEHATQRGNIVRSLLKISDSKK
jgi:TonB family protein